MLSDEPPPLDQFEDRTSVGNIHSDLFSGGEGLFDDSDDDFWGPKKPDTKEFQEKVDKVPDMKTPLKSVMVSLIEVILSSVFEYQHSFRLKTYLMRKMTRICSKVHRRSRT